MKFQWNLYLYFFSFSIFKLMSVAKFPGAQIFLTPLNFYLFTWENSSINLNLKNGRILRICRKQKNNLIAIFDFFLAKCSKISQPLRSWHQPTWEGLAMKTNWQTTIPEKKSGVKQFNWLASAPAQLLIGPRGQINK